MSQQIFRKEALDRLASPEQLDQLMSLTSPRGWIALGAVGMLLAMVIGWGFLGSIAVTVQGEGVLVRPHGVYPIMSTVFPGRITKVFVLPGQAVKKGDVLARVRGEKDGEEKQLASPIAGRVLALETKEGATVDENAPLLALEAPEQPLVCVLFLHMNDGYRVQKGMDVRILPTMSQAEQTAFLRGKVTSAARYPASRATLYHSLRSEDWTTKLAGEGPLLEVVVELLPRDATGEAVDFQEIFSGTPCNAQITVARQRPIELVVPMPAR